MFGTANSLWQKHSLKLRYQYQMFDKPTFNCIKKICLWQYIRTAWWDKNLFFIQVSRTIFDPDVRLKVILGKILLIWKMWYFSKMVWQIWQYLLFTKLLISHFSPELFMKFWSWVSFFVSFFSQYMLFQMFLDWRQQNRICWFL